MDVVLDGKACVSSSVEIAYKSFKRRGVGTTPKPVDHAWAEIDVEHDRLSCGEKGTREPSQLCGFRPLRKHDTTR